MRFYEETYQIAKHNLLFREYMYYIHKDQYIYTYKIIITKLLCVYNVLQRNFKKN